MIHFLFKKKKSHRRHGNACAGKLITGKLSIKLANEPVKIIDKENLN